MFISLKSTRQGKVISNICLQRHDILSYLAKCNVIVLQGGGAEPRGAVERAVFVHVQDVRECQHRRAGARAHAHLRAQGVQGSVLIVSLLSIPFGTSFALGPLSPRYNKIFLFIISF